MGANLPQEHPQAEQWIGTVGELHCVVYRRLDGFTEAFEPDRAPSMKGMRNNANKRLYGLHFPCRRCQRPPLPFVIRLSLGKLIVDLLRVVKRTDAPHNP